MRVQTIELDLPALWAAFARRLRQAGLPVGPDRAARFSDALAIARPVARTRLYWVARAVFVSDRTQVAAFDRVFFAVFGSRGWTAEPTRRGRYGDRAGTSRAILGARAVPQPDAAAATGGAADPPGSLSTIDNPLRDRDAEPSPEQELPIPVLASDEEITREKRFDALSAEELVALRGLMKQLSLATPRRLSRRAERRRHGNRIDLRRTLRASMRTRGRSDRAGAPPAASRATAAGAAVRHLGLDGALRPRVPAVPGLCGRRRTARRGVRVRDPADADHARLAVAQSRPRDPACRGRGARLVQRHADRRRAQAVQRPPRPARDGSRRGDRDPVRRWERGNPAVVGRELERLSRLAHRIVWVNPRAAAAGFEPRAGGMAAALPFCDALVSGHNLASLREVAEAIAAPRVAVHARAAAACTVAAADEETRSRGRARRRSPGSSVAMPSGYGPSRGRTTPGWGIGK